MEFFTPIILYSRFGLLLKQTSSGNKIDFKKNEKRSHINLKKKRSKNQVQVIPRIELSWNQNPNHPNYQH